MQAFHFDLSTKSIAPVLNVKQGDVGRKFQAVITDRGVDYNIPAGAQFSVWFSGPSGEGNYSAIGERSAFTVDGNTVTVELIAQMLQNPGTGAMCLVLNAVDGSQIGLWNVIYSVEAVPGMGSKTAQEYYTALSELARQAIEAAATFETDTTLSVSGKAADAAATGAALAGKAPAGYGLGDVNGLWCEDPNTATKIGFYRLGGSATVNVPNGFEYGTMIVERRSGCIYQTVKNADGFPQLQTIIRCSKDSGATWSEWECVNPPMTLGVEYRTTERDNGKVVHAKKIDFGALPNSTYKYVNHGATLTKCIRYNLVNKHSSLMLTGHRNILVDVDENVVQVSTNADLSAHQAWCDIWYTKD